MNKLFIFIASSILAFSMLLADYEITGEGVVFTYSDSTARQVFLAGDFNDWKTDDLAMERNSDGIFRKLVKLSPGRYEYKFVVDGKWTSDPLNPVIRGDMGNSVIKAQIEVIEPMGNEIFLHFNISKKHCIARVPATYDVKPGDDYHSE